MADITNKRINIYIDQQAAETALQKLQLQADGLTKKITAGQAAGKSMVAELKKLDGVNDSIKKVQSQLDNGLKPSLAQQTSLVSQLRNELKRLSESDPSFAAKLKNYQSQNAELQRMQGNIGLVSKETSNWGNSFDHVLERIAEYASIRFVFEKVKEFLSSSIEEANKAEQANSRLQNILSNIGRIDAFDRLKEKAHALSEEFKLFKADEVEEVFTKLITYGKLTENQINDLTPVIVNFAEKQRISLSEATDVITKSLEGNSKGLKQYGINLKDANTVTERFGELMTDLKPRVEGAAEAFGETTQGQIKETEVKIDELKEKIGTELQPLLKGFYAGIASALEGIPELFNSIANGINSFGETVKYNIEILYQLAKGGPSGAAAFIATAQAQAKTAEDAKKAQEDLATISENVSKIVEGNAEKTVDEQKKLLQSYTAIRDASLKTYNDLVAQGKQNTAESRMAVLQYIQDYQTVDALSKKIASEQDKRVLGSGDPNYDPNAQKKYEELLKAAEEFNKKLRDLQNESANANKTADQKEIDNIKHKYDEVLIAYEELQKKLKGSGIHLALTIDQIKGLEDAEIAATIRKQMRAVFDASQKEFDAAQGKQYADALAESDKHFSELKAAQAKQFTDGTIDYKEYQKNITAIDEQSNAQKIAIAIQYTAFSNQAAADVTKFQKTQLDQQTKDAVAAYEKQLANEKSVADLVKQTALKDAQTKVDIALKGSSDEYLAKKNYLDIERQQQLKALEQQRQDDLEKVKDDENRAGERIKINDSINTQIADTNAKFDAQQKDLHAQHIKGIIDAIAGYASQAVNILGTFVDARNTAEQSALQKELNNNEKRKQSLQKLLNGKFIDESKYAKEIAAIDADSEKKKQEAAQKEFERTKKVQLAQALINGAMGVTAVLAAKPGATDILSLAAFRAVNVAITLATTAAQIATISAQKPKFAKGGALTGPSHSQGGMPVINPTTGAKEAEVEGGEYIISKNTVRNNKGLADALLFTSLYRNGAPVNRNYVPVDYAGITKTYNHLKFALGGVVPAGSSGTTQPAESNTAMALQQSNEINMQLMQTLGALTEQLKTPIKGDWNLKQLEDAQAQKARIVANANFKG